MSWELFELSLNHFCVFFCVTIFLFFLENYSITSLFFTDIHGITLRVTSLNKPFCSISLYVGRQFQIFLESFYWYSSLFLRAVPILSYENWTDNFCITLTVNVVKKFSRHASLCWEHNTI